MLTLIKMKWILMLFLLLYTAGSYLHCAVLYGDVLAQKYTIVLDFKDYSGRSRTGRHHQADWNQDCL